MLKSLRNNTKSVIWFTVGIFILSFVIGSAISIKGQKGSAIAKIFNKKISRQEYQIFYDLVFFSPRIQNLLQQNPNAPDSLIMTTALQYIALYYEARSRGFKVNDADVKDEIHRRFSLDGIFDPRIYERHVQNVMRRDLRYYEEIVRKELYINKLLDSIRDSVTVSDEEARIAFDMDNKQFTIQYFSLDYKDLENQVPVIDDNLRPFYDAHKQLFAEEEKYDFAYLHFPVEKYLDEATVSDDQIADYYAENQKSFIDPTTQETKSLADVKDAIALIFKTKEAKAIALERAFAAQNLIRDRRDVAQGASEAGVDVVKTGFRPASELESLFGASSDFYQELPSIPPKGIRVIQTEKGVFVLILDEKEYAYTPPFPEIVDKVKTKFIEFSAREQAHKKAQQVYDEIMAGTLTFDEAVDQAGGVVKQLGPFSSMIVPAESPFEPLPRLVAFLLENEKDAVKKPYDIETGTALIKVIDTIAPDEEIFEKNKKIYHDKIFSYKSQQIVNYEASLILQKADIQNYLIGGDDPFANIQE